MVFQKVTTAVCAALILLTLAGCKKLDKLTQFEMDYVSTCEYEGGLPISIPIFINSPDVTTNAEEEFAINDTRKDLIESIKLTQLRLTIKAPQGQTFSFLKSIEVYIVAGGLPEIKIAGKANIPDNVGAQFDLDLYGAELKDYVKADKFTLKVESVTDQYITSNVSVEIYSKFFVDAEILGI